MKLQRLLVALTIVNMVVLVFLLSERLLATPDAAQDEEHEHDDEQDDQDGPQHGAVPFGWCGEATQPRAHRLGTLATPRPAAPHP